MVEHYIMLYDTMQEAISVAPPSYWKMNQCTLVLLWKLETGNILLIFLTLVVLAYHPAADYIST